MYDIYTTPSYARRNCILFLLAAVVFAAAAVCAGLFLKGTLRLVLCAAASLIALAPAALALSAATHRSSWLLCRADEEELVFSALRIAACDVKTLRIWAQIPTSLRLNKKENPQDMLRRLAERPPLPQLEGTLQLTFEKRTLRYTVCNAMETAAALHALGYPVDLQLQRGAYVLSYPLEIEEATK